MAQMPFQKARQEFFISVFFERKKMWEMPVFRDSLTRSLSESCAGEIKFQVQTFFGGICFKFGESTSLLWNLGQKECELNTTSETKNSCPDSIFPQKEKKVSSVKFFESLPKGSCLARLRDQ